MRITKRRIEHMHAVAEFMYEHAKDYNLDHYEEQMYILGLLHDIGYVRKKKGHAKSGAEIIRIIFGQNNFFAECIEDHGLTPKQYAQKHNIKTEQIPLAMILLWTADLSIDSKGNEVGISKRLEDIKDRYGKNSEAYKSSEETAKWLRTEGWQHCNQIRELHKFGARYE